MFVKLWINLLNIQVHLKKYLIIFPEISIKESTSLLVYSTGSSSTPQFPGTTPRSHADADSKMVQTKPGSNHHRCRNGNEHTNKFWMRWWIVRRGLKSMQQANQPASQSASLQQSYWMNAYWNFKNSISRITHCQARGCRATLIPPAHIITHRSP